MSILKALKNFIIRSGGTTEAKTIASAINDIPASGSGGYKKYELKFHGAVSYIDGLTLEEFKKIYENRDNVMIFYQDSDAEYYWYPMTYILCDDEYSDYSMTVTVEHGTVAVDFDYDPEDGLFKSDGTPQ